MSLSGFANSETNHLHSMHCGENGTTSTHSDRGRRPPVHDFRSDGRLAGDARATAGGRSQRVGGGCASRKRFPRDGGTAPHGRVRPHPTSRLSKCIGSCDGGPQGKGVACPTWVSRKGRKPASIRSTCTYRIRRLENRRIYLVARKEIFPFLHKMTLY